MKQYVKKPVEVKIEKVTESRRITTLEGTQDIQPGQYLCTGVKGEQYAFGENVFAEYLPSLTREGYYFKPTAQQSPVWAFKLGQPIEVFRPGWQHRGKAGDYFVVKSDTDQYVVDAEVFEATYQGV